MSKLQRELSFVPGSKIICTRPRNGLTSGEIYTVIEEYEDMGINFVRIMDDKDKIKAYFSERFLLKTTTPSVSDIDWV